MINEQLEHKRHSLAHLLAAAIMKLWPDTKRTIGPAIDDGFYFDFEFSKPINEGDLEKIEKEMRAILPTWTSFERIELSADEAKKEYPGNEYKHELIDEFTMDGSKVSFYKSGDYSDLCRGGHVNNPAEEIDPKSFKLDRIAGAYWRGNEKNKMLTRIYGLAFDTKEELESYITKREEARSRDHKKIGKELDLFIFHETAPGMPYWLPKGLLVYNELVNFWRNEHKKMSYQEIASPLVNKAELWKISGHWEHYKEDMFIADMGDNEIYGIKPMNCPNAMVVFGTKSRSYRDLPLRLSDTDRLHRYERSGTLNGLLRARSFQQDDSHNFITEDMIGTEFAHIFDVCEKFYSIFNLEYSFRLGTRPENFLGDKETWDKAEKVLKEILATSGKSYYVAEGDGAFYGPKVDIVMKDSLGRDWQMGTIQLDFQLPQRFELEYADKDGGRKTPVVVHRVIYGSLERFIGILIEHLGGAFPLWLSPVQVKILPISENQHEYAERIRDLLEFSGIRFELDTSNESLGKKVRQAKVEKVPYWLVIGDKEKEVGAVTLESRDHGNLGQMTIEEVINRFTSEIKDRA